MKTLHLSVLALAAAMALSGPAAAACYADYKAKREDPLRLHYGVMKLPDDACGGRGEAAERIARRIGRDGWKLLDVMSIFGKDGLAERKAGAGAFYLRY